MTENLALIAESFVKLGLSGYDTCYAALARDLKGIWITFDEQAHKLIQKEKMSFLLGKRVPPNWPG